MDTKDLEERYRKMATEELVSIAFADIEEYTTQAIRIASDELRRRGISLDAESTIAIAKEARQKIENDEIEIRTKPLSRKQRILFTIFPGFAHWYIMFSALSPKHKTQRIKEANQCIFSGLIFWFVVYLVIYLLVVIIRRG
jgi:hypothetical protein